MALEEVKRWAKDRLSHDEQISIHPSKAITSVNDVLVQLSASERKKNIENVKAYADLYYQGRHNMDVPKEVQQRIEQLEKRAERANVVDQARQTIAAYGGPPTKETIAASLERSRQERSLEQAPAAVKNTTNEKSHEKGLEGGTAKNITNEKAREKGIDLAAVAANTLKTAAPTIEKDWAYAVRKGAGEEASAQFRANLEGLNALRKDLLEKHPEWATKLPAAVNVQEVSQRIAENQQEIAQRVAARVQSRQRDQGLGQ